MLKKIYDKAVELLFPGSCPICGEIIGERECVCRECKCILPYVEEPCCLRCGCEMDNEEAEFCESCQRKTRSYIQGFPAMNYSGPIRDSLARFKYHGMKSYGGFYAKQIMHRHGNSIKELGIEALIPVPIHRKKQLKRGYNQAEILAKELGKILDVPVDGDILIRHINTLPQNKLNDIEREINLEKAFISSDKIVKYNSVMLVDDIYTTGSTVEACTRALKTKGIKNIYYTSVCVGRR